MLPRFRHPLHELGGRVLPDQLATDNEQNKFQNKSFLYSMVELRSSKRAGDTKVQTQAPVQKRGKKNSNTTSDQKSLQDVGVQKEKENKGAEANAEDRNSKSGAEENLGAGGNNDEQKSVKSEEPKASQISSSAEKKPEEATESAAVQIDTQREKQVQKSPLLEKGIIYFFYKPKISVQGEATSISDVQRSFIVLKPLPAGAKLKSEAFSKGPARLLTLPKKSFPTALSHGRYLTFINMTNVTNAEIQSRLSSETYRTATMGERTNPAARPIAEGVYAITKQDRTSHLVFELTIPDKLTHMHEEFGLTEKASFVVSVRNPKTPSPPQARLPESAHYPTELQQKFGGLRWLPLDPVFMNYDNCEILFIGEHSDLKNLDERVVNEMDQLEHEDEVRAEKLDESIYDDLKLRKDEFKDMTEGSW